MVRSSDRVQAALACIWWGDKYSVDYVQRLARAVRRQWRVDLPMLCLTNHLDVDLGSDVEKIACPTPWPGWWQKIHLFNREVMGRRHIVYLDLDVVLLRPINGILENLEPYELRYAQDPRDEISSSLLVIDTESRLAREVVAQFDADEWIHTSKGDQDYFARFMDSTRYAIAPLDPAVHYSYKCLVDHDGWRDRVTNPAYRTCSLDEIASLNFHGFPKPGDLKRTPSQWKLADTILDYW